jgi:PPP family 3-phenylpropionic acid transporter
MLRFFPKTALSMAAVYIAIFFLMGMTTPFWPLWLKAHGLSEIETGLVAAAAMGMKLLSNPVASQLTDKTGSYRIILISTLIIALALLAVLTSFIHEFWSIFFLSALFFACVSTVVSLSEAMTISYAYADNFDYGRVRMFGSLSFMISASCSGFFIDSYGVRSMPIAMAVFIFCTMGALLTAPKAKATVKAKTTATTDGTTAAQHHGWKYLLTCRPFLIFLGAAGFVQMGHAMYYTYSAMYWKGMGISENIIGLLWGIGVIAEILLLAFSTPLIQRFGTFNLMLIGAIGGIIRWTITAFTLSVPMLVLLQTMHAMTFACAHIGAMHFLARYIPSHYGARAQAAFSIVALGPGVGLAILAVGPAYAHYGGFAFLSGTFFCSLALICNVCLRKYLGVPHDRVALPYKLL